MPQRSFSEVLDEEVESQAVMPGASASSALPAPSLPPGLDPIRSPPRKEQKTDHNQGLTVEQQQKLDHLFQDMNSALMATNEAGSNLEQLARMVKTMADNVAERNMQPQPEVNMNVDTSALEQILENALKSKKSSFPPDLQSAIVKDLKVFEAELQKFVRCKKYIQKTKGEAEKLAARQIPPGHPRLKVPFEFPQLDKPINPNGDLTLTTASRKIQLEIPRGTSFRDVHQLLFFECAELMKCLEKNLAEFREREMAENLSFDAYKTRLGVLTRKNRNFDSLGLKFPSDLFEPVADDEIAREVYRKLLTKLQADATKEEEEAEKKRKQKMKKDEEEAKLQPIELLRGMVKSIFAEELSKAKGKGKGKGSAARRGKGKGKGSAGVFEIDYVGAFMKKSGLDPAASGVREREKTGKKTKKARKWTKSQLNGWKNRGKPFQSSLAGGQGTMKGKGKGKGKPQYQYSSKGKAPWGKAKGKGKDGFGKGKSSKGKGKRAKGKGKGKW